MFHKSASRLPFVFLSGVCVYTSHTAGGKTIYKGKSNLEESFSISRGSRRRIKMGLKALIPSSSIRPLWTFPCFFLGGKKFHPKTRGLTHTHTHTHIYMQIGMSARTLSPPSDGWMVTRLVWSDGWIDRRKLTKSPLLSLHSDQASGSRLFFCFLVPPPPLSSSTFSFPGGVNSEQRTHSSFFSQPGPEKKSKKALLRRRSRNLLYACMHVQASDIATVKQLWGKRYLLNESELK